MEGLEDREEDGVLMDRVATARHGGMVVAMGVGRMVGRRKKMMRSLACSRNKAKLMP